MSMPGLKAPSSLARRLVRMVVAFGLGLALLTSAVQAWWSYRAGLASIRQTMDQIGQTHAMGVAKALWDLSSEQVSLQLQGMLNFPYLNYVAVWGDGGFVVEAGRPNARDVYQRAITLSVTVQDRREDLGVLILQADTSKMLTTVLRQVLLAFVFQSAVVGLVVAFFHVLFRRQVTGNLEAIAGYLGSFDMAVPTPLVLNKPHGGDEFDTLVDTFNAMHRKIQAMYQEVVAAQQAARAGEERLNLALEASEASTWDMDYEARLVWLTSRDRNLFGGSLSGVPVSIREWMARIHPEDAPGVRLRYKDLQGQGNDVFQADFRFRTADGAYRWTHTRGRVIRRSPQGRPLRMVGILMDLSERKNAEDALRKTTNILNSILEAMPSAVIGLDGHGLVTHWNKAGANMSGVTVGWSLGRPLADAFPWLDRRLGGSSGLTGETVLERLPMPLGDETRMVDIHVWPIGPRGTEGVVIRLDDVTARAQMEEMMVQSEKMISVGGLAAGIAHEINNPLGVILQSVQNVELRLSPDLDRNRREALAVGLDLEALRDYLRLRCVPDILGEVRAAGERAADIIRSMLRFSRGSEDGSAPCDLAVVVDAMIDLVTRDFDLRKCCDPGRVRFVREYDSGLGMVPCAETQIGQVVFNILKNAVQALAKNREPDFAPKVVVRLARSNGQVRLELEDNGPGLAPAVRKRIFEPFFTTKPPGEGTGLGLSVSYYIVTSNHKGHLFVESEPGRGAKFVILLPATAHVPEDGEKP